MAGNSRPSFLKRQKEQKRLERANEKRAVRQARREAKASQPAAGDDVLDMTAEEQDTAERLEPADPEGGEPGADEPR